MHYVRLGRTGLRVSRLCLVVHGWSFYYTLDRATLRVIEVRCSEPAS